ncbi:MAG: helix-turn-helix transcriptional regulator [Planctomycetes bacterium]|nr:helix-turn-helix transcriptional regulator [Planctomycetota bacterium]
MAKSFLEQFVESPERLRLFEQERAISEITGLLCRLMEKENISRADLAARLGKTKGWVTQLLDGERNKTVRTVADVFAALGQSLGFWYQPIDIGGGQGVVTEPCPPMAWESDPAEWEPAVSVPKSLMQVG